MSDETTPQDGKAMSPASAGSVAGKPVAWMVTDPSGRIEACRDSLAEAAQLAADFTATEDGDVVYTFFAVYGQPKPAITAAERAAAMTLISCGEQSEDVGDQHAAATLRGLLSRTGDCPTPDNAADRNNGTTGSV
jgi:hypothetical protein